MNIVEFVQAHNITLDILGNHGLQTEVGEGWQHVRYTVRLNYAGRSLTTAWRAGTGLAALGTGAGDAANILDSLVSDAASYTDARSFEETRAALKSGPKSLVMTPTHVRPKKLTTRAGKFPVT